MSSSSIFAHICLQCALSAFLLVGPAAAEERVLDLVADPTQWGPPKPTTFKGGGVLHPPSKVAAKPILPFELKLESIQPDTGDPSRLIVEFTIRNVGQHTFALPVGRNDRLIEPSRRGRRQLWIFLQQPNKLRRESRTFSSSTFGNSEKPSSTAKTAPGDLWRIRFPIRLSELEEMRRSEQAATLGLQVGLQLLEYEDDSRGLVLNSPSPEAVSENSLSVTLKER